MAHTCHAMCCEVPVPPEMLMCRTHWKMVPAWIRSLVWNTYRAGQCDDMRPSESWMIAAERAICAVAVQEGVLTKEQAQRLIDRAVDRFSRACRPPTRLINLRVTEHSVVHTYIGRGSPFGNPWSHNPQTKYRAIMVDSREEAIAKYRVWLNSDEIVEGWPKPTHEQIMALRGKTLACYCTPLPCHGDVLIDYIEAEIDSVSEDESGVSPSGTNSSEASSSSITPAGSGGGTDLRRGATLTGCGKADELSETPTRPTIEDVPSTRGVDAGNGHQAGAAKAVEPVPLSFSGLSPFLRWPGGKRWLVEQLVPKILACKPRLYVEPFLGAGAIALALPKTIPMLLSDYSEPLINVWQHIQCTPHLVATIAQAALANCGNTREGYLLAREHFNSLSASFAYGIACDHFNSRSAALSRGKPDGPPIEALERAGLMLYLNATSYNGVWRENKKGIYNVPFGDVKRPAISSLDELCAISDHLGAAKLVWADFAEPINELLENDMHGTVIYADPPYHSGFDDYIGGGFPDVEHERLAEVLFAASDRGAQVYTTNADNDFVRKLYANAHSIETVMEARNVAQKTDSRKAVSCLLIEV